MENIKYVKIIKRKIGNGCTEPLLSIIQSNEEEIHAIIKRKDNEQGILALINELICYKLAIILGLNMPDSGVAIIDINSGTLDTKENFISENDYGSCFYSKFIDDCTVLNEAIVDIISNKNIFEEIIIFDHIIYNSDRNLGNLLISTAKGNKILYVIDHTHAFKNGTIWDSICFKQGIDDKDYLDTIIMERNSILYNMFFRNKNIDEFKLMKIADEYKKIINNKLLMNIINELPCDWYVSKKDLDSLINYIMYRVQHLDDICKVIINYRKRGEIL